MTFQRVAHVRNLHKKNNSLSHPKKKTKTKRGRYRPHKLEKQNNHTPLPPCFCCGKFHWSNDCLFHSKECLNYEKVGHKSSHCKSQNNKDRVWPAISNKKYENNIRKYGLKTELKKTFPEIFAAILGKCTKTQQPNSNL